MSKLNEKYSNLSLFTKLYSRGLLYHFGIQCHFVKIEAKTEIYESLIILFKRESY